eukprot:CAMPEP_0116832178 /NCGR_PEP_ID=MMETSP0418-20121206/5749_1 /TAXON_ID=1158023 /ORGANISM="Astrosyne radiata, Strain 13vi08-1A" /LENGTH=421 /DNA_ID=CAMNT_0004461513 /DNA_START=93 /DNA_END=1358 /DNA_ORIENTATION=+
MPNDLSENMETLSPALQELVVGAKELYNKHFSEKERVVTVAPGRVNLIGEHTDYTGGFVFPLAIDYATVVYGSGKVVEGNNKSTIRLVSKAGDQSMQECTLGRNAEPPTEEEARSSWTWYVVGVVAQYLSDLPESSSFELELAICGNVPLGSGLSSSAALEVSTARFLEEITKVQVSPKDRALRCQKAENAWCHSPCGIMDQYVSSAATSGNLLLIDCTSFAYTPKQMKEPHSVVLVITNSNVKHSIGAGEYPVRVAQCKAATKALFGDDADMTLRNATLDQVLEAKEKMDPVSFRRAHHVVTENARTLEAARDLEKGDWEALGQRMNQSHTSMRDDYEVSCEEIDILVKLAQGFPGVLGSRLTGGGFGGCTVTLVEDLETAHALMEHLKKEYKAQTDKDCECFVTNPGPGARYLGTDTTD